MISQQTNSVTEITITDVLASSAADPLPTDSHITKGSVPCDDDEICPCSDDEGPIMEHSAEYQLKSASKVTKRSDPREDVVGETTTDQLKTASKITKRTVKLENSPTEEDILIDSAEDQLKSVSETTKRSAKHDSTEEQLKSANEVTKHSAKDEDIYSDSTEQQLKSASRVTKISALHEPSIPEEALAEDNAPEEFMMEDQLTSASKTTKRSKNILEDSASKTTKRTASQVDGAILPGGLISDEKSLKTFSSFKTITDLPSAPEVSKKSSLQTPSTTPIIDDVGQKPDVEKKSVSSIRGSVKSIDPDEIGVSVEGTIRGSHKIKLEDRVALIPEDQQPQPEKPSEPTSKMIEDQGSSKITQSTNRNTRIPSVDHSFKTVSQVKSDKDEEKMQEQPEELIYASEYSTRTVPLVSSAESRKRSEVSRADISKTEIDSENKITTKRSISWVPPVASEGLRKSSKSSKADINKTEKKTDSKSKKGSFGMVSKERSRSKASHGSGSKAGDKENQQSHTSNDQANKRSIRGSSSQSNEDVRRHGSLRGSASIHRDEPNGELTECLKTLETLEEQLVQKQKQLEGKFTINKKTIFYRNSNPNSFSAYRMRAESC